MSNSKFVYSINGPEFWKAEPYFLHEGKWRTHNNKMHEGCLSTELSGGILRLPITLRAEPACFPLTHNELYLVYGLRIVIY